MKALNIVETAYRATLEEQDDTIVWLTHAMKGAGADLDLLLRGNAVNYAVKGQETPPLAFGARQQKQTPRIAGDVAALSSKGVRVFAVEEDLRDRGIGQSALISGLTVISKTALPGLFEAYDQVWHW